MADNRKNDQPVVQASQGGCWFCSRKTDDMYFTMEWDAYFHKECLMETLKKDPQHEEAKLIKYEFSEWFE